MMDLRPGAIPSAAGSGTEARRGAITKGIVKSANQAGFLPSGVTPSVDGRPKVLRRCPTEPCPRSGKLSNISSDASRTSPTVLKPAAVNALECAWET